MEGLSLVETVQGVLAIGGRDEAWNLRSEVLKLVCTNDRIENCQWQEIDQRMKVGRYGHVAIALPESFSCL